MIVLKRTIKYVITNNELDLFLTHYGHSHDTTKDLSNAQFFNTWESAYHYKNLYKDYCSDYGFTRIETVFIDYELYGKPL